MRVRHPLCFGKMKLDKIYKNRYETKMRRYRAITLVLLIQLISIVYVVLGWRVVAAVGIIFVFITGLLYCLLYLLPANINPEKILGNFIIRFFIYGCPICNHFISFHPDRS